MVRRDVHRRRQVAGRCLEEVGEGGGGEGGGEGGIGFDTDFVV